MNTHIKLGDKVKIHYKGTFEDGEEFDSSFGSDPLTLTVGNGEVIKGLDEALIGMEKSQKKKIHIPSDKAYGSFQKELVVSIKRETMPADITLKIGKQLQIPNQEGIPITVTIKEITDDAVLLDANHPLAGKNLIFEIEIIDIE